MPYKAPEKQKQYFQEYKKQHRLRMRELNRLSYERHKIAIQCRRQIIKALKDPDLIRRKNREYGARQRQRHRIELNRRARERYKEDTKYRLYSAVHRARKRNTQVGLINLPMLIARDTHCAICHRAISPRQRSLDHILPLSCGGIHTEANVRIVHIKCNLRRNNTGIAQLRLLS